MVMELVPAGVGVLILAVMVDHHGVHRESFQGLRDLSDRVV